MNQIGKGGQCQNSDDNCVAWNGGMTPNGMGYWPAGDDHVISDIGGGS